MMGNAPIFVLVGYAVAWAVVGALLVAMAVVDVRTRRIPNKLVAGVCLMWTILQGIAFLFGVVTGESLGSAALCCGLPQVLMSLFVLPHPLIGVLTAAVAVLFLSGAGALYERSFSRQPMGAGDVKLIGAFALFLGPGPTIVCVMFACLLALVTALPARLRTFPFAPALIVAFVCTLFVDL